MKHNTYRKCLALSLAVLTAGSVFAIGTNNKLSGVADKLNSALSDKKSGGLSFSNDEAVQALKAALGKGAETASSQLHIEDAYYKNPLYFIDMPPEAEKIVNTISKLPQGKKAIDDVVLRLNRTAESCAAEIVPIFTDSITSMSVSDGINIVKGEDNAATQYLQGKTYSQLVELYKPKVAQALDQKLIGNMSANEAWSKVVTTYNKAGSSANKLSGKLGKNTAAVETVDTDLSQYATEKALDAIFLKIADEEKKIRDNPVGYGSDIITKVFGSIKK